MSRATGEVATGNVYVRFYDKSVRDEEASRLAGRPVHRSVPYISLRTEGDGANNLHHERPVREGTEGEPGDAETHAKAWEAYKRATEMAPTGTPLEEWPRISRAQVDDLAFFGLRTVEQLSRVEDKALAKMPDYTDALRGSARDYLSEASGGAPFAQLREDLDDSRERERQLREQMEELRTAPDESAKLREELERARVEIARLSQSAEAPPRPSDHPELALTPKPQDKHSKKDKG